MQNDVFKLQKDYSELEISVGRTWKFLDLSYFTDLKQTRGGKKIPKTVLKTRFKTKKTIYTLVFVKYLVVSF
jgi:hypothetical protein